MKTYLPLVLACVLAIPATADAGPMLTGTVSYDRMTGVFTYSYTLDDRGAMVPVDQIFLRVANGLPPFSLEDATLASPAQYTWSSTANVGSSSVPGGNFIAWRNTEQTSTGEVVTGFSLSTIYEPTTDPANNYFILGAGATNTPGDQSSGVLEVGQVVAPDFGSPPALPEPSTLILTALGMVGVGLRTRGRRGPLAG